MTLAIVAFGSCLLLATFLGLVEAKAKGGAHPYLWVLVILLMILIRGML